ncbi:MAG: hypothetical protein IJF84_14370 [Thermoguttaceae bacterium]|nr:hypothetical protein [Thermoguttaceae bacterium]
MVHSTPNFELPVKLMTFNEKEEWWECPLFGVEDKPVIVWLEPSYEEKRIYFNVYMKYDNERRQNISRLVSAVLFPRMEGAISACMTSDHNRLFFDFEGKVRAEETLEEALTFPLLFYVMDAPALSAWTIPYRPKPKKQEELTEGERIAREKRMEEAYAEWLMQQELQKKQLQEQKEQTEKEWEEWEKRQAEGDDKQED